MKLSEGDLKEAYRSVTAPEPDRADCPAAAALARAAAGEDGAAERQTIVDHLGLCAACAEDYRTALSLQPWVEGAVRSRPHVTVPARRRTDAWGSTAWTLAAAAALAIAVAVPLSFPTPDAGLAVRGGGSIIHVEEPRVAGVGWPPLVRWQAIADAQAYRLVVFDEAGALQWTSDDLYTTTVERPPPSTPGVTRGYWQVRALGDGRVIAQSRLVPFRLAR